MRMHVENLGALEQADVELGDMTIICGKNNTGKTYAAYALFGFLYGWKKYIDLSMVRKEAKELAETAILRVNLDSYAKKMEAILDAACCRYVRELSEVFASEERYFESSEFKISLSSDESNTYKEVRYEKTRMIGDVDLSVKKQNGSILEISLYSEGAAPKKAIEDIAERVIFHEVSNTLFGESLVRPYIISSERTGVATFRKELDSSRTELLEELRRSGENENWKRSLDDSYQNYPLPVKVNIRNNRDMIGTSSITHSFLSLQHPEVRDKFIEIAGGEYDFDRDDAIYFRPSNMSSSLTIQEGSSAVRSLLDMGFYLRTVAKKGDLLIIDEPELNLHAGNQCLIARLLARMVKLGIKVLITTHSDYILKELNTLIMLSEDTPRLRKLAAEAGYCPEEIIPAHKIKTYIAENKNGANTLVEAKTTTEYGIELPIFDEIIDAMNRMQDEIVWGED